jgi:hypothetical protein
MVDLFPPEEDTPVVVDLLLIICVLVFMIVTLVFAIYKDYLVMTIGMICAIVFVLMFMVTKGWGRQ